MRLRLVAAAGVLLVVAGMLVITRADAGLVRERTSVDGMPVSVLRPSGDGPFPGVVVVHGFSGSSRLMDGIGIAFARAGWLAALPDLPGHGANPASLGEADLPREVLEVVDWLDERADVDQVAMLGHSMGAGAVVEAAAQRPELPVVALSLPSAESLDPEIEALVLVGGSEPARFAEAAEQAGELGFATGTVSGAEHLSILFRTQTLRTSLDWLDEAVGRSSPPVDGDWRLLGVGAAYLGSALLFWPLSAWVVRPPGARSGMRGTASRVPRWVAVPVAGLVAGGVLAAVPALGESVPLLVGGYLAAFFALTGLGVHLTGRRLERPFAAPVASGLALGAYSGLAVAVPAQLAWAQVSLAGPRSLAIAALVGAILLFAWAELALSDRYGYPSVVAARLLLSGVLAVLAVAGAAPGFLLLLLPLVALVLPWFGAYGVRVARLSGSPLGGALAQAPALALLVAVTTPLA